MANHHRKSGYPPFDPGRENTPANYRTSSGSDKNLYQSEHYPYPNHIPNHIPNQHPIYYQPCLHCPYRMHYIDFYNHKHEAENKYLHNKQVHHKKNDQSPQYLPWQKNINQKNNQKESQTTVKGTQVSPYSNSKKPR